MGAIIRGARNAFRNLIRTASIILILALSIGLALVMLLSYKTVQAKIASVQESIGNTVTVTPAGARGFEGGGEPLTTDQAKIVAGIPHVTSVSESLADRQTPGTDTSLASAIDPGTLGARFNRRSGGAQSGQGLPTTFSLPVQVTGISDAAVLTANGSKLTSGAAFDPSQDADQAVVGAALASKNNLSVGSTFTAYGGTSVKVVGIFDAGNTFANAGLYMPLVTVERLSGQAGEISQMTVQVDTINDVDGVVGAIQGKLGTDKADVTSTKDEAAQALSPLENIKTISLYSLLGALAAGAIITLLSMVMIVRERRREIGVLKAIGSSNAGIVTQFVSESLVLTLLGSAIGMLVGVAFSDPVLKALLANSESAASTTGGAARAFGGPGGGGFVRVARFGGQLGGSFQNTVRDLHAVIGVDIILYGLAAALVIAVLGSAVPAWFIAKIKPAEVMRGE